MTSPYLTRPPRTLAQAEHDRRIAEARRRLRLIRVDGRPLDPAQPYVDSIPAAAATPRQSRPTEPRAAIHPTRPRRNFFARLLGRFR